MSDMPPPTAVRLMKLGISQETIVNIPHLSETAFDFLKGLLDTYKAAIVRVSPDNNVTEAGKPAMLNDVVL